MGFDGLSWWLVLVEAAGIEPATIICNILIYLVQIEGHVILGHKRGILMPSHKFLNAQEQ